MTRLFWKNIAQIYPQLVKRHYRNNMRRSAGIHFGGGAKKVKEKRKKTKAEQTKIFVTIIFGTEFI